MDTIDFSNSKVIRQLQAKNILHQPTLEHYYLNYNKALWVVINAGLQESYAFNVKKRGLLFLLQHSLELCLKWNLERLHVPIPASHNLSGLVNTFPDKTIIPENLLTIISKIDFDPTGSAFRYLREKGSKNNFFDYTVRIDLSEIIKLYNAIPSTVHFRTGTLFPVFQYDNKRIRWSLTLHLGESAFIGHVRSEFDNTTELLLSQVIAGNVGIGEVYLPLLFMVRHSLELAWKENIMEVQAVSSLISAKDQQDEHSLYRLYSVYKEYLDRIDTHKLDAVVQSQYHVYKTKYDQLNEVMHNLDSNARQFRYPFDKTGKPYNLVPSRINLFQILESFYFTDAFITFSNTVFEEAGILK